MTSLNIQLMLKNKVLWAWPIIAVLVALLVGWYGDIQSAGNSYSFLFGSGNSPLLTSGFLIKQITGFFILIAIIGLPTHFGKNLESNRASMLLSKPISRTDFFISEFAAVITVTLIYTLITNIVLAVLLAVEAGIFPYQLYLGILFYIPLYILAIYVSIVLLLVLTRSYLASVLIAFLLLAPLSGFLLEAETFLSFMGLNTELMVGLADGLSYLVPSTAGVDKLMVGLEMPGPDAAAMPEMSGVLINGFGAFNWQLFGFVQLSCLPFFLLSLYLMRRKQF